MKNVKIKYEKYKIEKCFQRSGPHYINIILNPQGTHIIQQNIL